MSVLGYYGAPRVFHCARCGPGGLVEPVEEVEEGEGLDYAREDCAKCGRWVDENEVTPQDGCVELAQRASRA